MLENNPLRVTFPRNNIDSSLSIISFNNKYTRKFTQKIFYNHRTFMLVNIFLWFLESWRFFSN